MVESKRETWHRIIKSIQDVGIDGFESFELRLPSLRHERTRAWKLAVGQVAEYAEQIAAG